MSSFDSVDEKIGELRRLRQVEQDELKGELDETWRKEHTIRIECYTKALWIMGAI
jgi:hypothetical protein